MRRSYKITITHLYPQYMNIYGDMGNIITLKKRCGWRNINVKVRNVSFKDSLPSDTDIYFMGGGQDADQLLVFKDLLKKKRKLIDQIESGVGFLVICGAYQLFGRYFITGDGKEIEGIGVLDVKTQAPGTSVKTRCIGNVVARLNPDVFNIDRMQIDTIVGFENHSGQTHLGQEVAPLAYVVRGYGNNMGDDTEGCIYKSVIGTYLHGSFLPKNPHVADWLILNALKRKYGKRVSLKILSDEEELEAHRKLTKS